MKNLIYLMLILPFLFAGNCDDNPNSSPDNPSGETGTQADLDESATIPSPAGDSSGELKSREDVLSAYEQGERDFSAWNLANVNLSRVDLSGANFTGANFTGSNLSGANFTGANFTRVNFTEASLRSSNFRRVNFAEANLSGADLRGADLNLTNFKEAKYNEETNFPLFFFSLESRGLIKL